MDDTVSYVGGNATIFTFDAASGQFIRRTTTVKKENGERAIGTSLAADSPAQPFVRRGEAYYGPTTLFGRRFYTVYQPTFDAAGSVNGMLYVGIPAEFYFGMYDWITGHMALSAAVIAVVICLITNFAGRRLFRPLRDISARVEALAAGDLDTPIQHAKRRDITAHLSEPW